MNLYTNRYQKKNSEIGISNKFFIMNTFYYLRLNVHGKQVPNNFFIPIL